tara:strand:+ start:2718 stop:2951 length:234 start_codon:yes stop_codon:yes gene_type:complete
MIREKQFVINDKHGNRILEGEKFTFKYLKELDNQIELIGSFDWNDEELRYEIDIHDNEDYVCLSFVGNGVMSDFETL